MKTRLLFCFILFTLCFGVRRANAGATNITYLWTPGGTNTDWNNSANWNYNTTSGTNAYPGGAGTGDIVYIYVYSPVTINYKGTSSAYSIGSITVALAYGTITLNLVNASGAPVLTVTGGVTVTNYDNTTLSITASTTGTVNLTGGSLSIGGSDAFTIGSGVSMALTSCPMTQAGYTSVFTNSGTFTADANSSISLPYAMTFSNLSPGTFTTNATVNMAGGPFINSGSMTSNATSSYTGNTFGNSGPITANSGGAMTFSGGLFTNTGATITAHANMTFSSAFTNSGGTVTADNASTYSVSGNFSNSGTMTFSAATALNIAANSSSFTNTGTIQLLTTGSTTADPTFTISGSNLTFNNTYTSASLPGIISLAGLSTITSTNVFTISANGGPITNTGSITATHAPILISGNAIANIYNTNPGIITLSAASPLTVSNGTTFANTGTISADLSAITFQSATTFSNSGSITLGSSSGSSPLSFSGNTSFTNTKTFSATSSAVTFNGGTTFNNTSPGTFTLQTTSPFYFATSSTITNTGTITSTSSAWTMGITSSNGVNINNNTPGSISLTSSPVSFPGNNTISNTGTFNATNSSITMTGNPSIFSNPASTSVFTFSGGTFTLTNAGTITNGASGVTTSIFTINGSSTLALGSPGSFGPSISNYGIFNAGTTAGSYCDITTGSTSQVAITNYANGNFNLGSTSRLTLSNTRTGNPATVTNNGVFTLESDQYGSASIGASGTPTGTGTSNINQFVGTFNVQRFIKGNNSLTYRGYRLLSSPVNLTSTVGAGNITLAYINTNASIVNANAIAGTTTMYGALTGGPSGSANGFTTNGAYGNPTIYLYNEGITTNITSSFTSGKTIGVTKITAGSSSISTLTGSTAGSATVPVGNGYFLYFIGNNVSTTNYTKSHIPEDTYITAKGTINQQSVPVTIWWTPASTFLSDASSNTPKGYNLVGNPYPSTIDLNILYTDNGSTFHNFAELNDVTGTYVYWDASTSTPSGANASEYIASGQGFFVQATGTSQTLTFKEGEKVYNRLLLNNVGTSPTPGLLSLRTSPDKAAGFALKPASITVPADFARMHVKLQKDSVTYDECAILFGSKWSDKFDDDDAYELQGSSQSFIASFSADGIRTSINKLGDYTKGKRVALYVKGLSDGLYTLTLTDITNVDTSLFNVYLIDNNKKDSLDMVRYKTYSFNLTAADTAAIHNRFAIVIEQKPLPPYALLSFTGQKGTGGVQLTWKTANEGNFTGFGLQKLNASKQYALIDSVQSNGNGLYNYIDQNPINGNNVYRLEQNDINGKLTYSAPITINYNNLQASGVFTIYPNPAKELVTFTVNSSTVTTPSYTANIYNTSGALMGRRVVNTNTWSQDVTSYKPGVYIIELKASTGDMVGQSKFVKTN